MKYVEYDSDGNIFHVCEAFISPPDSIPAYLKSSEDKARHEAHYAYGRSLQLASLIDSHEKIQKATPGRGIHVLEDDHDLPTLATGDQPPSHKYDHATSTLRSLTTDEVAQHAVAWEATQAAEEAREQARVDKAVERSLAARQTSTAAHSV